MPRQLHPAGRRLRESDRLSLVGDLLKRGARTRTVGRITGEREVAIRDVYREIFGTSPQKGPSEYRADWFIGLHLNQFQSSLAARCIEVLHEATRKANLGPSTELGRLYCQAYDQYLAHLAPLKLLLEPLCFERFAQLSVLIADREEIAPRRCVRCCTPFVAPTTPGATNQKHCPYCRIIQNRGCARCNTYVPLDSLECAPRARPRCSLHAIRQKEKGANSVPAYFSRSDDASDEAIATEAVPETLLSGPAVTDAAPASFVDALA